MDDIADDGCDDARAIVLGRPARSFIDTFLLGNGSFGAAVSGGAPVESWDLALDTVWSGGPVAVRAGGHADLGDLRAAVRRRDHTEADRLARDVQSDRWTQSYQPLGRVRWRWSPAPESTPPPYRRTLDPRVGMARTRDGDHHLTSFVSHPDDVLVALAPSGASPTADFTSPHPLIRYDRVMMAGVDWLLAGGRAPALVVPDDVVDPEPVRYGDEVPGPGATARAGMGWAVAIAVQATADGVRLLCAAASGFRGYGEEVCIDVDALIAAARATVTAALTRSDLELERDHREDHSRLFDRTSLDLLPSANPSAAAAQRLFDLGRHLLIGSSRPGTQAANLQGVWNTEVRPAWSCDYTTNINLPMNYWAAETAGLAESHEPLLRLIRDLAEAGSTTAVHRYGASGAVTHHNTDLWRMTDAVAGEPRWANWSMGLAWLAAHLGEHLDFTWSEGFARETAWPVLVRAAQFVLDQLMDDDRGDRVVCPSTSPEHSFIDADTIGTVTAGSTLDQEVAHQLLSRLVRLAARLNLDDAIVARARHALAGMRLPGIDARGRWEEWAQGYDGAEPDHRHLSHLYGVFPGARITASTHPGHLRAAHRALIARLDAGGGYTGWSQAWVLALAARMGDAGLADQALHRLTHDLASSSLLGLHPRPSAPGGYVFQIDGNLGAVAGILELLVQSHDGAIALLPTLPSHWPAGSVRGVRARGGATVDMTWAAGGLQDAAVTPDHDGPLVIDVASNLTPSMEGVQLQRVTCVIPGRSRWKWRATGGRRYILRAEV